LLVLYLYAPQCIHSSLAGAISLPHLRQVTDVTVVPFLRRRTLCSTSYSRSFRSWPGPCLKTRYHKASTIPPKKRTGDTTTINNTGSLNWPKTQLWISEEAARRRCNRNAVASHSRSQIALVHPGQEWPNTGIHAQNRPILHALLYAILPFNIRSATHTRLRS